MPKPANWRIVHSRPRYIDGYTPRVNGNCPGSPGSCVTSAAVYSGRTGSPESVTNSASRSGVPAYAVSQSSYVVGNVERAAIR